mmetsp:Transcript_10604/g.31299  ORF Transcript_10604/g.31299 Transcript_10604/m.31299 type:complete len:1532 (-) Transcript_10604:20-4615(-)
MSPQHRCSSSSASAGDMGDGDVLGDDTPAAVTAAATATAAAGRRSISRQHQFVGLEITIPKRRASSAVPRRVSGAVSDNGKKRRSSDGAAALMMRFGGRSQSRSTSFRSASALSELAAPPTRAGSLKGTNPLQRENSISDFQLQSSLSATPLLEVEEEGEDAAKRLWVSDSALCTGAQDRSNENWAIDSALVMDAQGESNNNLASDSALVWGAQGAAAEDSLVEESADILSPEERRRMVRVLEGKPPSGNSRRRSCQFMLKRGIGSQASLESMGIDDSSDDDDEGNGSVDVVAPVEKDSSDDDDDDEFSGNQLERLSAEICRMKSDSHGSPDIDDRQTYIEDRVKSAPSSALDEKDSPKDAPNATRNCVNAVSPSPKPHPERNLPPNTIVDNGNDGRISCESKEKANGGTTQPGGGKAGSSEGEEEEDLASEALRHLSACELCALYERIRDMCERGYSVKSRFEDIDINAPQRPVRHWVLEQEEEDEEERRDWDVSPGRDRRPGDDYPATALRSGLEEEVVTQGADNEAWVKGGPVTAAVVCPGSCAEPETERPQPGLLGVDEDSEDDDQDEDEAIANALEVFGCGGAGRGGGVTNFESPLAIAPGRPAAERGVVAGQRMPRRTSIRWAVDEAKPDSSESYDREKGPLDWVPPRQLHKEAEPSNTMAPTPQQQQQQQEQEQPMRRQSILRRSSFLSKAMSVRSLGSAISAVTEPDTEEHAGDANSLGDFATQASSGLAEYGGSFGQPIGARRSILRSRPHNDGLQGSFHSTEDEDDETTKEGETDDEDDEHHRCTLKLSNLSNADKGETGKRCKQRKKKKKRRERGSKTKYLNNTRTAGSVVRRLMEEVEATMLQRDSTGDDENSLGPEQSDHGIMSEFRRWVAESRTSNEPPQSPEASPPLPSLAGGNARCTPSSARRMLARRRRLSSSTCSRSYFETGSLLGLMMERGVEIAYYGSCPVGELNFCLCANRSIRTVKVVFLGSKQFYGVNGGTSSILGSSCARPRFVDHRNPLWDCTSGGGPHDDGRRSKVVRLHEGFCSSLLRRRRDTGWGPTKFDEIAKRVDGLGRELCCNKGRSDATGGPSYRVVVAGHGLGGAIATAFSFFYAANSAACDRSRNTGSDDDSRCGATLRAGPVQTFSYGSPRVGDAAFRSAFQHLERTGHLRHVRCVIQGDLIPLLPVLAVEGHGGVGRLFKHVGLKVVLSNKGNAPNGLLTDVSYPLETGWAGELKRACADSFLPHLLAITEFSSNHSLTEHHKRLQLAQQGDLMSIEKHYLMNSLLKTESLMSTKRRHLHAVVLLTLLVASHAIVSGSVAGVLKKNYWNSATDNDKLELTLPAFCPLAPQRAAHNCNASQPSECHFWKLEGMSVLDPVASNEQTKTYRASVELSGKAGHTWEEKTDEQAKPNRIASKKQIGIRCDFPEQSKDGASENKSRNSGSSVMKRSMHRFAFYSEDADVFSNPSGFAFIDRKEANQFKWGVASEPSTCHPIDSDVINDVQKRAKLKSMKVEGDARAYARSNFPSIVDSSQI